MKQTTKSGFTILTIVIIASALIIYINPPEQADFYSTEQCNQECQDNAYTSGFCKPVSDANYADTNHGSCLIKTSVYCENPGQCYCFCYDASVVPEIDEVCCKIYGLGAYMEKVNIHYKWTTVEECEIPEGIVGGGREVVSNYLCES